MIYTVQEFCEYVDTDLNAFIEEVAGISRNVSDEEKKAYAGSYPAVANMLNLAIRKNGSSLNHGAFVKIERIER